MRVIAHVERSLDGAIVPKMQPKLFFFGRRTRHKPIPSRRAIRIPRQAHVDWFVTGVWLGAVALGLTWWAVILYGFFYAIRTGW